ncbi:DUF1642 domain-containing protein [Streptococcus salivarius]
MTRQEAIEKLSTIGHISVSYAEDLYDSFFPKPVVPQYVADWYEEIKDAFEYNLIEAINNIPFGAPDEEFSDFEKWLEGEQSLTTLVNMHQFGYEVEKEPRYTVRLKGLTSKRSYLNYLITDGMWYFNDSVSAAGARTHHTRKKLEEAGFGWVFDCPGVEVKEVE